MNSQKAFAEREMKEQCQLLEVSELPTPESIAADIESEMYKQLKPAEYKLKVSAVQL